MPDKKLNKAESGTDWAAFDALTDEDIAAMVAGDPDAAPISTDDQLKNAKLRMPKTPR